MAEPRKDEQDDKNKNPPPGSQPNYPQPGQGGFKPGENNPQPGQDQRQGEQRQGEQRQGGQNQSDKRDR